MAKLSLLVSTNLVGRLAFFLFKYTAVFYFGSLLGSKDQGKTAVGLILGLTYIAPILWSGKINTTRGQVKAVWLGTLLLLTAYVALSARLPWALSGLLFAIGFGLVNSNFKAVFGSSLREKGRRLDLAFTLLMFSTNGAAAIAAFVGARPEEVGLSGLCNLFVFCAVATLTFGVMWRMCIRDIGDSAQPNEGGSQRPSTTRETVGPYPSTRLFAVLLVIFLATLFWTGFELRSMSLNQFAKEHLCPTSWGLHVAVTHLQSINPLFYVALAPLFIVLLNTLHAKSRSPHPFYWMGAGVAIQGAGLFIFARVVDGHGHDCIGASPFVLLYVIQTIGELLLEPIGLDFVTCNAPMRFATLFLVLWECNSGAAYLLGILMEVKYLAVLGLLALLGGLAFMLFTPLLRRYVK